MARGIRGIEALREAAEAVRSEGGGVINVAIYTILDVPSLALEGQLGTLRALRAVVSNLRRRHDRRERTLCFCCSLPIQRLAAVVLIRAGCEQPSAALAGIICSRCEGTQAEMHARAFHTMKELSPGLRVVQSGVVGHA